MHPFKQAYVALGIATFCASAATGIETSYFGAGLEGSDLFRGLERELKDSACWARPFRKLEQVITKSSDPSAADEARGIVQSLEAWGKQRLTQAEQELSSGSPCVARDIYLDIKTKFGFIGGHPIGDAAASALRDPALKRELSAWKYYESIAKALERLKDVEGASRSVLDPNFQRANKAQIGSIKKVISQVTASYGGSRAVARTMELCKTYGIAGSENTGYRLTIGPIKAEPNTVLNGQEYELSGVVTNKGTMTSGPVIVKLFQQGVAFHCVTTDVMVDWTQLPPLAPGQSATVSIKHKAPFEISKAAGERCWWEPEGRVLVYFEIHDPGAPAWTVSTTMVNVKDFTPGHKRTGVHPLDDRNR